VAAPAPARTPAVAAEGILAAEDMDANN
jgi:hypothetical protein